MKRSGWCTLGLVVTMVLFLLERGNAENVNTTIPVSVTVAAACSISGTGLNFGNYVGAQLTSTGAITVTCSQDRPYNVTLDRGLNSTSNLNIRGMRDVNSQTFTVALQYFLYKDSAMTQEWGDSGFAGTYPLGTSVSGTGTGSAQTLTIYGKLLADQLGAAPGIYTDTVVATLLF